MKIKLETSLYAYATKQLCAMAIKDQMGINLYITKMETR